MLTSKQLEAQGKVFATIAEHVMLFGGSRSSKTYLICRNIVLRAVKAPKSRHVILRFRFNAVKTSIGMDTMPKVFANEFPDVGYSLNKTDWFFRLDNGSEIWLSGLDSAERTEKILGHEYVTLFLNECSQIPFDAVVMALTRLAQRVMQVVDGESRLMPARAFYDENPPTKGHWTFKQFIKKINPDTGLPLANPDNYVCMQLNPMDNQENLSQGYIDMLKSLSARAQKRFLFGEFADDNPNALFNEADIDKWRVMDGELPDMVRIVVGVDPSGASDDENENNDDIGITIAGIGTDGIGYVLEDCTIHASPKVWGNVATSAFDRYAASMIVGEKNFGGEMVRFVIQTARPGTPFKFVTSSRGKHLRAEPISSLYELGKVRHVGKFRELEEEMLGFSTFGYTGNKSPNRADSMVFALTELFPRIANGKPDNVVAHTPVNHANTWMSR
jgi:hypothetical protein